MKRAAVVSVIGGLFLLAAWWWSIGFGARTIAPVRASGPLRILALGDSLAYGYGSPNPTKDGFLSLLAARIARLRTGSTFENDAVCGTTISMIAGTELPRVRIDPDVVIAVTGGNDVEKKVAIPPMVAAATAHMLDDLRRRFPRARLLVTDIPDVSRLPIVPRIARAPFHGLIALDNLAMRRAARAHGAIVLPLYEISRSPLSADPANFYHDGMHPSQLGYRRLAEMLWPSVRRAITL